MKKQSIIEKLNALAPEESTSWLEKAKASVENEGWLDRSAEIALVVLRTLRAKSMTQVALAEALDLSPQYISRVVKGRENLTLETIDKLEKALGITLISVPLTLTSEYSSPLEVEKVISVTKVKFSELYSASASETLYETSIYELFETFQKDREEQPDYAMVG